VREGFLKGPLLTAKAAPPDTKYRHFMDLSNVDTRDKVVTEDDLYIENGTSLQKDIHNFLVASIEKNKKICILENQNRKNTLKNKSKDEAEKYWGTYKKAPGTQTSEKNSETKKGGNAVEAQSLKKEEVPKWKATRVPFSLKKIEAAKWLA
jgi:hypothetical protein